MKKQSLIETRPTIQVFHRAINAVIHKGSAKSGPDGRKTDGFIYVLEGSAHYELDDYSIDVKAGDFFYLARNTVYSMTAKSEHYCVIIISFASQTSVCFAHDLLSTAKKTRRSYSEKYFPYGNCRVLLCARNAYPFSTRYMPSFSERLKKRISRRSAACG